MRTCLLACIRGATERIVNAELKVAKNHPIKFGLMAPLRILRELVYVPRKRYYGHCFFLPDRPRANSKTGHVYDELIAAGIPADKVVFNERQAVGFMVKFWRVALSLHWAFPLLALIVWRQRRYDRLAIQIILGHTAYRRWLRKCPNLIPVIISDVSPQLHMLWSAAAQEGPRALWWQDDFHHAFRLPYGIIAGAVLNKHGLECVRKREATCLAVARPGLPPLELGAVSRNPVLGIATNVTFAAEEQQLLLLQMLAQSIGAKQLELRLHPNSKLDQSNFPTALIRVAPSGETMEKFSSRVDLVVVGNTAAQLWLTRTGKPTIHVEGLDEQGFDLYGYVKTGWVFGVRDPDSVSLEEIREFFDMRRKRILQELKAYTTTEILPDMPGLEALAQLVE